jgi:multidrug efflux pump subunit AcrA (membrane-fusion protein)
VWAAVQEGQPLFTLDSRETQAQLAVNEANVLVAEATLWHVCTINSGDSSV